MHFFPSAEIFWQKTCKSSKKTVILHRRIIKIDCFTTQNNSKTHYGRQLHRKAVRCLAGAESPSCKAGSKEKEGSYKILYPSRETERRRSSLLTEGHFSPANPKESEQGGQKDADGIGQEIEPFAAAASARAIGLQKFNDTTHEDGSRDGPKKYLGTPDSAVRPEIFPPNETAGDKIHHHVGPLVYETHIVERSLRSFEEETRVPNRQNAKDGQWVASDIEVDFHPEKFLNTYKIADKDRPNRPLKQIIYKKSAEYLDFSEKSFIFAKSKEHV